MMRTVTFLLFFSAFILFPNSQFAHTPPAEKVKLRLNLKQGDSFQITSKIDQDISQVIMGQPQNINQSIGIEYRFDVVKVIGKMYSVDVTYTRTTFDSEGLLGEVNFDSDSAPEKIPPTAIGYAAMVGQSFKMIVNSQGEVKMIDGIDAMIDNMIVKIEESFPGAGKNLSEKLKDQYGDENMRSTMEQLMAFYPKQKVKVGDEWEKNVTVNTGFTLQLNSTYKLVEITDNEVKLEIFSKIVSDPTDKVEMNAFLLSYEMAGHQKGMLTLNKTTGWTKSSSVNQDLSGEVTMEGENLPEAQTWPISIGTASEVNSN